MINPDVKIKAIIDLTADMDENSALAALIAAYLCRLKATERGKISDEFQVVELLATIIIPGWRIVAPVGG